MLGVGTYPSSQPPSLPSAPNSENPARAKGVAGVSRGGQENGEASRVGGGEAEGEEEEEEELVAEETGQEEGEGGKGMQSTRVGHAGALLSACGDSWRKT